MSSNRLPLRKVATIWRQLYENHIHTKRDKMITKKKFIEWLESKGPFERVGVPTSQTGCPLACSLRDAGQIDCRVLPCSFGSFDAGYKPLPEWARNFVFRVDHHSMIANTYQITAKTCLKIMEAL